MTTEYVAGLCAIFTAFGALLTALLTKWADARVKIINAEAAAKKEQNDTALATERACVEELKGEVSALTSRAHASEKQHAECERKFAYMEGKFEMLEKKVTAIETVQVQPIVAPVQVQVPGSPNLT